MKVFIVGIDGGVGHSSMTLKVAFTGNMKLPLQFRDAGLNGTSPSTPERTRT